MKTAYLFCIVLIWSTLPMYSQNTLSGVVKSVQTKESLIGASIQLVGTDLGTITNTDGSFSLNVSQEFPINLTISYIGYQTVTMRVESDAYLEIFMYEGLSFSENVVISASRKTEKTTEAPASITVLESRRINSQALSNPAQALRNIHGVDVTQQGIDHFQVNLRGRNAAFTTETYFMKDFRNLVIPGQGAIALGRTSLNELDMDRMEVVRGPGSALYGPGVETGVVHFISKSAYDKPGTSISVGTGTQANISFAGRHAQRINDRLAYKIVARYDEADDFVLDPDDPTDAESLAAFQPQVISGLTGEVLSPTNELEDRIKSYSISGELEYKYNESTRIYLNGGYNYRRGIVRADLGEALQDYGNYFSQLKMVSKNWFAQFYLNGVKDDSEKSVLYRTGITNISKNNDYHVQVQYDWPIEEDKWELNIGSELQWLRMNTLGTVHGRFEDDDNYDVYSVYAQSSYNVSDQLDFILAGRVDRFSAIDETTISPRAGLIYYPSPSHNIRLTFNKAVSSPSALFVYGDIPFGVTPAFDIEFLGGIQPLSFSDPLVTESFLPGVGSYDGIDLSLSVPYAIATAGLAESFSTELVDYLNSKLPEINTSTAGLLSLNGNPVTVLPERDKIRSTKTSAFELGYKGIVKNKLAVGLDVYYNRKKDLIFAAPVSPFVVYPQLSEDLVNGFLAVTSDAELAAFGVNQELLAGIYTAIGDELAAAPLGLVSPEVPYDNTQPVYIVSPTNTGKVEYFGADLSLQYYVKENFTAFANYSWINQNYFEDDEIGLDGTGQVFALNTPKNRIRLGFDYIPDSNGWSYGASARYQDEMEVQSGTIFAGTLEAYTTVDLYLGYKLDNGLRLTVTALNALDESYRVMPRMPRIGRLILVKAVYDFQ